MWLYQGDLPQEEGNQLDVSVEDNHAAAYLVWPDLIWWQSTGLIWCHPCLLPCHRRWCAHSQLAWSDVIRASYLVTGVDVHTVNWPDLMSSVPLTLSQALMCTQSTGLIWCHPCLLPCHRRWCAHSQLAWSDVIRASYLVTGVDVHTVNWPDLMSSVPLTLSQALMSAPCPRRRATISRCPWEAARCRAVRPRLSFVCSWKVDLDNSRLITDVCPFSLA